MRRKSSVPSSLPPCQMRCHRSAHQMVIWQQIVTSFTLNGLW